mmetsp:Transcript_93491/g.145996  ORF Transcript_93491/g.145996 Transcript_93491/m.145996 type:complete len:92 (+) Transcript_93491:233-508(+)
MDRVYSNYKASLPHLTPKQSYLRLTPHASPLAARFFFASTLPILPRVAVAMAITDTFFRALAGARAKQLATSLLLFFFTAALASAISLHAG